MKNFIFIGRLSLQLWFGDIGSLGEFFGKHLA
jgi:hypothetical protein